MSSVHDFTSIPWTLFIELDYSWIFDVKIGFRMCNIYEVSIPSLQNYDQYRGQIFHSSHPLSKHSKFTSFFVILLETELLIAVS